MKYDIMWGRLLNSKNIFALQRKVVRIVVGAKPRNLCRSMFFKILEILPLLYEYTHS